MFTSTSPKILDTNFSSAKKRSRDNPLAILFFIMGAPHIYGFIQRGAARRQFLGRYLTILFLGTFAAGMVEVLLF